MRKPAGDRGLMAGLLDHRRDLLVAGRALAAAEVDDAVLGVDAAGEVVGAAVGARRVAGDQIEDFEPVLDRADAILDRCGLRLGWHDELLGACGAGGGSFGHTTTVNRFAARVMPV